MRLQLEGSLVQASSYFEWHDTTHLEQTEEHL
jgi:hypothetical protein